MIPPFRRGRRGREAGRRIAFLATGLGRGGAETQLVRVAVGLAERGWQPHAVSLMDRNLFGAELAAAGIPYHCLRIRRGRPDPRGATRLLGVLRRIQPDVLCSFLTAANTLGPPVARIAGVPVVVTSIRNMIPDRARSTLTVRATAPFGDAVVFNSAAVAADAAKRGIVSPSSSVVIHNGIDVGPIDRARSARAEVRSELGLEADDFAWISVAHLRPEKNHAALVRAFRRLRARFPEARLLLAGGLFGAEADVKAAAADLLDSGAIRFVGNREDVPRVLTAADAFVLASLHESSPNALIEALAARLPAVATRVGGVPEVVPDRGCGVVIDGTGADELLDGMSRVMEMSDADRAAMGDAGRGHVERTFGLGRLVDEWEDLLVRLLGAADSGVAA